MRAVPAKKSQGTSPVTFIENLSLIPTIEKYWDQYKGEHNISAKGLIKAKAKAKAEGRNDVIGYQPTYWNASKPFWGDSCRVACFVHVSTVSF